MFPSRGESELGSNATRRPHSVDSMPGNDHKLALAGGGSTAEIACSKVFRSSQVLVRSRVDSLTGESVGTAKA